MVNKMMYPGWRDLNGLDFIARKQLKKVDVPRVEDIVALLMSGETLFIRTPSAYYEVKVNPDNLMTSVWRHDSCSNRTIVGLKLMTGYNMVWR